MRAMAFALALLLSIPVQAAVSWVATGAATVAARGKAPFRPACISGEPTLRVAAKAKEFVG